jgi:hypothetical protein
MTDAKSSKSWEIFEELVIGTTLVKCLIGEHKWKDVLNMKNYL